MISSRWLRNLGVVVVLAGCGTPEDPIAFAELGELEAEAEVERDVCECSDVCLECPEPKIDRYTVTLKPTSDEVQCPSGDDRFSAAWLPLDDRPLQPSLELRCTTLIATLTTPAGAETPVGQLALSDRREQWVIDNPFRSASLNQLAALPMVGDRLELTEGDLLELAPSVSLTLDEPRAHFESESTPPLITEAPASLAGSRIHVEVPALEPGLYALFTRAPHRLSASACKGPVACRGLGASSRLDVVVP